MQTEGVKKSKKLRTHLKNVPSESVQLKSIYLSRYVLAVLVEYSTFSIQVVKFQNECGRRKMLVILPPNVAAV